MTENQNTAHDAPITYASAGVDVEAGDRAVELMKDAVKATHTPEVMGGIGGFAGMWDASALLQYRKPLLTTSTDGVGTKVAIAQAMDKHDTIGQDLVGMVVDDIVVVGAQPLFMTDYIACGRVVPERIADIVRGVAEGCRLADTALVGGETAEHPGLLRPDEYDVAGATTGVVEADELCDPDELTRLRALLDQQLAANQVAPGHRAKGDQPLLGAECPEQREVLGQVSPRKCCTRRHTVRLHD